MSPSWSISCQCMLPSTSLTPTPTTNPPPSYLLFPRTSPHPPPLPSYAPSPPSPTLPSPLPPNLSSPPYPPLSPHPLLLPSHSPSPLILTPLNHILFTSSPPLPYVPSSIPSFITPSFNSLIILSLLTIPAFLRQYSTLSILKENPVTSTSLTLIHLYIHPLYNILIYLLISSVFTCYHLIANKFILHIKEIHVQCPYIWLVYLFFLSHLLRHSFFLC